MRAIVDGADAQRGGVIAGAVSAPRSLARRRRRGGALLNRRQHRRARESEASSIINSALSSARSNSSGLGPSAALRMYVAPEGIKIIPGDWRGVCRRSRDLRRRKAKCRPRIGWAASVASLLAKADTVLDIGGLAKSASKNALGPAKCLAGHRRSRSSRRWRKRKSPGHGPGSGRRHQNARKRRRPAPGKRSKWCAQAYDGAGRRRAPARRRAAALACTAKLSASALTRKLARIATRPAHLPELADRRLPAARAAAARRQQPAAAKPAALLLMWPARGEWHRQRHHVDAFDVCRRQTGVTLRGVIAIQSMSKLRRAAWRAAEMRSPSNRVM